MRAVLLAMALLAAAACQPSPTTPPPSPPDATTTDPACVAHCAHAAALGCPEGQQASCAVTCTAAEGTVVGRVVDWSCVDRATDVFHARPCGVRFCLAP